MKSVSIGLISSLILAIGLASSNPAIAKPIATVQPQKEGTKYKFVIDGKATPVYTNSQDLNKPGKIIVLAGGKIHILCLGTEKPPLSRTGYNEQDSNICGKAGSAGDDEVVFPSSNLSIPYIISPRSSLLSTTKPRIAWNAIRDAKKYTLILLKDGKEVDKYEYPIPSLNSFSTVESIEYPSKWKELQQGFIYDIIINLDNNISSKNERINQSDYGFSRRGVDGLGFRLLDESTRQKRLNPSTRDFNLNNPQDKLALSFIYRGLNLHSEAIQILEELVRTNPKEPVEAYRFLAQYYGYSGLENLAYQTFEKAQKNAEGSGNLEEIKRINEAFREFNEEIKKQKSDKFKP
jgi:hypothetical protein